jgi:hypothetical protein
MRLSDVQLSRQHVAVLTGNVCVCRACVVFVCVCFVNLQWGVRLPRSSSSRGGCVSPHAGASQASAAGAAESHTPVLAFYLGKAGANTQDDVIP